MKKEDVVWHEEDESVVLQDDDGWAIILMANHFRYKFWYEIKTPDNYYLDFMTKNIYEAIDKLNEEKENYGDFI